VCRGFLSSVAAFVVACSLTFIVKADVMSFHVFRVLSRLGVTCSIPTDLWHRCTLLSEFLPLSQAKYHSTIARQRIITSSVFWLRALSLRYLAVRGVRKLISSFYISDGRGSIHSRKEIFLLYSVLTGSGVHPTSYPLGTETLRPAARLLAIADRPSAGRVLYCVSLQSGVG
jgi:hypothetical protein